MFSIPSTFKNDNQDYIVVNELRQFIKENNVCKSVSKTRNELVEMVENYANTSIDNKQKVLNWIDSVTKEGIKDVYVNELSPTKSLDDLGKDNYIENIIEPYLVGLNTRNICGNGMYYGKTSRIVKYEIHQTIRGRTISFILCKMINLETRNNVQTSQLYPIFVDIYADKKYISVRAKSKSDIFEYDENGFNRSTAKKTTTEREIKKAMEFIIGVFQLEVNKGGIVNNKFKKRLYSLLEICTKTPQEIQDKILGNKQFIDDTTNEIIKNICSLQGKYEDDVKYDIMNTIEKYFSITWPDKNIFTLDREAYPLKIKATDEEESKLEQTAALEDPLQSKAIFFDNKKMLQKSKKCDGLVFKFKKLPEVKGIKRVEYFKVALMAKKSYCHFKFSEFVKESDIDNVIFSVLEP